MNKVENHAGIGQKAFWVEGRTNAQTLRWEHACLVENSKVASWPAGVEGVLALECYREFADKTGGSGQKVGCLCSYQ